MKTIDTIRFRNGSPCFPSEAAREMYLLLERVADAAGMPAAKFAYELERAVYDSWDSLDTAHGWLSDGIRRFIWSKVNHVMFKTHGTGTP